MKLRKTKVNSGTLGKLMVILENISQSKTPLRFIDLVKRIDQPRGTLHRQISQLLEERLVHQLPNGSYEAGFRLLQLAAKSWSESSLRQIIEPFLQRLQEATGETVHLALLQNHKVVYLDKVEANQAIRMNSQIGNTSPIYCTGVGKAMLAALPQEEQNMTINHLEFHPYTANTICNEQILREELIQIQSKGYAEDRQEHEMGIYCVATAIVGQQQELLCGISITAPFYRVKERQLKMWRALIVEMAGTISETIINQLGPKKK